MTRDTTGYPLGPWRPIHPEPKPSHLGTVGLLAIVLTLTRLAILLGAL